MALTLLQKLNKIYKTVDHIDKNGVNEKQKYKFVRAADLAHAVRNAFADAGIYAEVNFEYLRGYEFTTTGGSKMQGVDVKCDIIFHDMEGDTKTYRASGIGSGSDGLDKASFKAQTGALKYALRNAFIVPDEADPENDADEVVEEQEEVVGPPKARIPKFVPPKPKEESVALKAQPLLADSSADSKEDRPVTPEELEGLKTNCKLLIGDLVDAGLKPSKGWSQEKKLFAYLLSITGARDFNGITRNQWDKFLTHVGRIKTNEGTKSLAAEVNSVSEGK